MAEGTGIYIVCWMTMGDKPPNRLKDNYKVFRDGTKEENLEASQEMYAQLLNNKKVYSANVCEVIKSTDY